MFPLTAAVAPSLSHLLGDGPVVSEEEVTKSTSPFGNKVEPLIEVFEAVPTRSPSDDGRSPQDFNAIIVISRAVPRPKERNELSCVIDGGRVRAVWLSWSMVLCSTAHVRANRVTIYIAFQDRRFSEDFVFLHARAPRHVRLGWPATESFDSTIRGLSWEPGGVESANPAKGGVPGSSGEKLLRTNLVICTIFKNEAAYLEEWLQYHQLLGISKASLKRNHLVYLYDNGSTDESRDLLRKYERSNFVEVRDWPYRGAQTQALNDCLCRFRHSARWMSFIDVDEFIDPAPDLPISSEGESAQDETVRLDGGQVHSFDSFMSARRKRLRYLLEEWAPERHTHCMPWVNYCS
ncbi:unnamed protein product, partial [Hapterophycus canaliculatus]